MDRAEYVREESWYGSFYELAIELGPAGDDTRAATALRTLWDQPEARGPWRDRTDFDSAPDEAAITIEETRLYGCFALTDEAEIGCMTHFIREDDGADWLDLSIPVGMLASSFPISYPLDAATNGWMVDFDGRLARIGAAIYGAISFELALIGEEASGARSAGELTTEDCERGGLLVPLALWNKLAPR